VVADYLRLRSVREIEDTKVSEPLSDALAALSAFALYSVSFHQLNDSFFA
jgi:hypothetical protein